MKLLKYLLFFCLLSACQSTSEKTALDVKVELPTTLTEISGIIADGKDLWAITDKPKAVLYKIDIKGNILQTISIANQSASDVEAVTADSNFVYIGDTGDNDGNRAERQIIKVNKTTITKDENAEVAGEVIIFRFPEQQVSDKKKKNNYDCESLLSFGDSLYVFTKRREDQHTELFSIPKTPGEHVAVSLGVFETKGLITDAAINEQQNEVALVGYTNGHKFPFILLLKDFTGSNFFSGKMERIELADDPWDWQMESIAYNNDEIYFACEKTKQVKATLYAIKREKLATLNKK